MTTLTILRGLPGCGKSYLSRVQHALEGVLLGTNPGIASADAFPGLYGEDETGVTIDVSKLDPAHGASVKSVIDGLTDGRDMIVDNTNLSAEEIIPYVALAQAFRVDCVILTVKCDPETAFARQSHNVPKEVFDGMVERFEAFEAPFHWQFLPWLSLTEYDNSGK